MRGIPSDAEISYRKGVHQALGMAGWWLDDCRTIEDVRQMLGEAASIAYEIRHDEDHDHPLMLHEIRERMARPEDPRRPLSHGEIWRRLQRAKGT